MRSMILAGLLRIGRGALGWGLTALLWLLRLTWRIRVTGDPPPPRSLIAFWHGDQLALTRVKLMQSVAVLVSKSRDGQLAASVARRLGLAVIPGSTNRGAVPGALGLMRRLLSGKTVALAADGPRGPRHRAGRSSMRMARRAGAALIPVAAAVQRGVHLSSWDRMLIPAPFTRIHVVFGPPVDDHLQQGLDAAREHAMSLCRGAA